MPSTRERLRNVYNFGGTYIYKNSSNSSMNYEVCNRMAMDLMISSIRVNIVVFASMLLLLFAPLYKLMFTNEHEMIIPIILPFIDPATDNGLAINVVNQLVHCFCGVFIIPGTELITSVLKNNISALAAVIDNSFVEFDRLLEEDKQYTKKHDLHFRNVILKVLDFDRFDHFNIDCHRILLNFN